MLNSGSEKNFLKLISMSVEKFLDFFENISVYMVKLFILYRNEFLTFKQLKFNIKKFNGKFFFI